MLALHGSFVKVRLLHHIQLQWTRPLRRDCASTRRDRGVPDFPGDGKILYYFGLPGWMSGFFQETAMDRLLTMDKQEYVSRMQLECRRIMEEIADAVNTAPTGNVISGAEMQVRDLMGELRRKAFETAVQMRIDSTESNFSPCEGSVRQTQGKKGARVP